MSLDQYLVSEECSLPHRVVSGVWYHDVTVEGQKHIEPCEERNRANN